MTPASDADSTSLLDLDPAHYHLSGPLCEDIRLLDRLLGEVLREQEGEGLIDLAHRLLAAGENADANPASLMELLPELHDPATVQRLLRAFTVLFQLLNT